VAEKEDRGANPTSEESGTGSAQPEILQGIALYHVFADSVKTDQRYFRNRASEVFLEEVAASIGDRALKISKDSIFWRARLGGEKESVTGDGVRWEEDRPHQTEGMKPIPNWLSEGRANPRGIRYLHDCSGCFRRERVRRVGLSPTGKRRLITAHVGSRRAGFLAISCVPGRLRDPNAGFFENADTIPHLTLSGRSCSPASTVATPHVLAQTGVHSIPRLLDVVRTRYMVYPPCLIPKDS